MSQEGVELTYQAHDAFNRRDLDGFLALMDPDIRVFSAVAAVEGGHQGHAGVRHWWESVTGGLIDFRTEVEEARNLGAVTVARVRVVGRGTGSETPFNQEAWQILHWREGKLVLWRTVRSESEALEAAGLSE
jgi:ketosteroid isomerase-like protein